MSCLDALVVKKVLNLLKKLVTTVLRPDIYLKKKKKKMLPMILTQHVPRAM